MIILQWIGIVVSGLLCICILYLAVVTFMPGFPVPEQPLKTAQKPARGALPEIPVHKKEVSFQVDGTRISTWLFLPEDFSAPVPCIVLGNGFGGTMAMGLEQYAARFRDAGFAALAFDYRHLGESGGEPRQLVWIPKQLADYQAAIAYARSIKEIDRARIALWGTSLSGGHVIVTAAKNHDIACVVAQCPGLDGRASAEKLLKTAGIGQILKMVPHGQRDFFRSWKRSSGTRFLRCSSKKRESRGNWWKSFQGGGTRVSMCFVDQEYSREVKTLLKIWPVILSELLFLRKE